MDASPAVDGDDGIEHLSHHAGKSATSWLAIVLVVLCGAGAWVRSNRWQRAKRERPDLEDPLSTQPLTSQSRARDREPRESLRGLRPWVVDRRRSR